MNFDAKFYLALLLRRLPYIVVIVTVAAVTGVAVAYSLPPVYRAEARLLVESPQIPDELASSTVRDTASEILVAIQQRLLARSNVLDLSRQLGIHADTPRMSAEEIVKDMRSRITIEIPRMRGDQSTGVVSVFFDAEEPAQTAAVVNALVTQILEQNVALRTGVTGGTLDFFQQEVRRLSEEMAQQNAQILEFKQANRDALPESLDYRRSRQAAQQERLLQVDRELAGLRDRRQRLTDLYDRTGRLSGAVENLTPEQARLEELRQELASALVIYSPQNPRVRAMQTQVAALERAVADQLGSSEDSGAPSTFDLQMADIDGQIDFLAEQKGLLERELTALEASIEATPRNAIALGALESDHDNLRVQHNQAVASLADARMGDRIEVTARGQRITVIEPASVPAAPAAPNRKLIAAAGLGAGLALATAFVVLLELLNRSVRRPAELVGALGIAPFGTIPYMATRAEIWRRRLTVVGIFAALFLLVPAALYIVHLYLMPMDGLIAAVAEKAGLGSLVERFLPGSMG
jgi:polysaccharide chain length determinant protein (PEP-CTERM system associated)